MTAVSGVLPILKPPGPSSQHVCQAVRRLLGPGVKVGHAGTLDPEAAGMLPVCVGTATRLADYLQGPPKAYRFELVLGVRTDTQDATGRVVDVQDAGAISEGHLRSALNAFRGRVRQRAPMYSARHQDGRRLYEYARAGREVERPESEVDIWDLDLLRWQPSTPGPVALCGVRCSSGTYIRTLCEDIGGHLGCGAHMGALVRCSAGGIEADRGVTIEEITEAAEGGRLAHLLIPAAEAVAFLPEWTVDGAEADGIRHGRPPGRRRWEGPDADVTVRILAPQGALLAVGRRTVRSGVAEFVLEKVLAQAGGMGQPSSE